MTSVFNMNSATEAERAEQARLAVKNFKALIPGFNSYIRALTGRPTLKIVVSNSTNSATDGQSIFMRPPLALGSKTEHQRGACDKIGADGFQRCPACRVREEVLSYLYHEIAHIVFDSFAKVSDRHAAEITQRAIAERGTKYSKQIAERVGQLSQRQRNTYPTLSEMVSPFLPLILNALEDARVNARMAESRPGTKRMAEAREARVFAEGVEQVENGVPVRKFWKDYQLNLQIIVGLYVKAAGRNYESYFAPQVVKDLSDPVLAEIASKAQDAAKASDTYVLAFQALDRLRELGYCKSDSDPEDEEEEQADDEPEAEPDAGDGDGESDQSDGAEEPDVDEAPGGDDGEPEPADEAGDPEAEEPAGGEDSGEDAEQEGESGGESGDPSEEGTPDNDDEDGGLSGETSEGGTPDDIDEEGAGSGEADPDGGEGADPSGGAGDDAPGEGLGSGSGPEGEEESPAAGADELERDGSDDAGGGDSEASDDAVPPGEPEARGGEGVGGERSDADPADPSSGDGSGVDDGEPMADDAGSDGSGDEVDPEDQPDAEAAEGDRGGEADGDDTESDPFAESSAPTSGQGGVAGNSPDDAPSPEGTDEADDLEGEAQASEDPLEGGPVDDQPGGSEAGPGGDEVGAPGGQPDEGRGPVDDDSPEAEAEREADSRGDGDSLGDGDSPESDDVDGEEAVELFESGEGEGIEVLEYGDASEVAQELARVLGHEEFSGDVTAPEEESPADQAALNTAILQGEYFETPSEHILGVNEFRDGVVTRTNEYQSNGWGVEDPRLQREYAQMYGANLGLGDFTPSESIMGPALLQMRVTFADNKRNKTTAHLKAGKINARALGKRAWGDDDRLFKRKQRPGKRSYFVMIGFDISGSQMGDNIVLTKEAVMAQAELLHRMGIPFALAAHSGSHPPGGPSVDIYWIKEPGQPWDAKAKDLFRRTQPDSSNIDGHTIEFYRKVLDKQDATDKVLMYYTDGKMPAFNHDEELEILQREIKTCKAKGYALMAVGIRTDSPKEHKLETAQVNDHADIVGVVKFLQRRLGGV